MCLVQVDEVGGGGLRRVADFGGAFAAEIEGWVAEKGPTTCCGRGAAGTDPAPRRGALDCWSASIDALYRVDLVRERRPAGRRASSLAVAGQVAGLRDARSPAAGSRLETGPRWQMDGVEPRGVGATRVVLVGVLVCSTASAGVVVQ